MKRIFLAWAFFFLFLFSSYDVRACVADADCSGGQVCCKCKHTDDAWRCGGDCIIPKGGYCCVNPNCIHECSGKSTENSKTRKLGETIQKNHKGYIPMSK